MPGLHPRTFTDIALSLIPLAEAPTWVKALWVEKELEARGLWQDDVFELVRPFLVSNGKRSGQLRPGDDQSEGEAMWEPTPGPDKRPGSNADPGSPYSLHVDGEELEFDEAGVLELWRTMVKPEDLTPEQADLASLMHLINVSTRLNVQSGAETLRKVVASDFDGSDGKSRVAEPEVLDFRIEEGSVPENASVLPANGLPGSKPGIADFVVTEYGVAEEPWSEASKSDEPEPVAELDVAELEVQSVDDEEPVVELDLAKPEMQSTEEEQPVAELDITGPELQSVEDEEPVVEFDLAEPEPQDAEDEEPVVELDVVEPEMQGVEDEEPVAELDVAEPEMQSVEDEEPVTELDTAEPEPQGTEDEEPVAELDIAEPEPESEPEPAEEPQAPGILDQHAPVDLDVAEFEVPEASSLEAVDEIGTGEAESDHAITEAPMVEFLMPDMPETPAISPADAVPSEPVMQEPIDPASEVADQRPEPVAWVESWESGEHDDGEPEAVVDEQSADEDSQTEAAPAEISIPVPDEDTVDLEPIAPELPEPEDEPVALELEPTDDKGPSLSEEPEVAGWPEHHSPEDEIEDHLEISPTADLPEVHEPLLEQLSTSVSIGEISTDTEEPSSLDLDWSEPMVPVDDVEIPVEPAAETPASHEEISTPPPVEEPAPIAQSHRPTATEETSPGEVEESSDSPNDAKQAPSASRAETKPVTRAAKKRKTTAARAVPVKRPAVKKPKRVAARVSGPNAAPAKATQAKVKPARKAVAPRKITAKTSRQKPAVATPKSIATPDAQAQAANALKSLDDIRRRLRDTINRHSREPVQLDANNNDAAGAAGFYGLHIDGSSAADRAKLLFFDSVLKFSGGDMDGSEKRLQAALDSLGEAPETEVWKRAIEHSLDIHARMDRPAA